MNTPNRLSSAGPDESDKLTVFASGLAVGLLVGGAVALLFAPAPGQDVRHAIARRGKRARRRGADAWDDLRHEFNRLSRLRRRHRDRHQHDDE